MAKKNLILSSFFSNLLEQIETAKDGSVFLPKNQLSASDPSGLLQNSRLIEDSQPLDSIICNGCDWRCLKPVQIRYDQDGLATNAFVICDERDDMGSIAVGFSQLEMQIFALSGIAEWIAQALSTNRTPQEIEANNIFHLGATKVEDKHRDLFLVGRVNQPDSIQRLSNNLTIQQSVNPVLITLIAPKLKPILPFVILSTIVLFEENNIVCSKDLLKSALVSKPAGKRGAKPQHDWLGYRKKFDEEISYFGKPGIDQPELKNQAALENKLTEWGEKTYGVAPSSASIRRYLSKWSK